MVKFSLKKWQVIESCPSYGLEKIPSFPNFTANTYLPIEKPKRGLLGLKTIFEKKIKKLLI